MHVHSRSNSRNVLLNTDGSLLYSEQTPPLPAALWTCVCVCACFLIDLEEHFEKLKIQRNKLLKKGSQKVEKKYTLRPRQRGTRKKRLPVIIQDLEYKPLQNTDMSDILDKLPTLQEGAHPWIAKLEEITTGTQFAIGDIKRLLANLVGIPAMGEIFQRAGLNRYVGTSVYDPELFAASRGRLWRALRDEYPTNVNPDNILIESLGQEENPRAYVSRAYRVWRNITGNDPDLSQLEQSILRTKLQEGLPLPVRSKLAEVIGLGSMAKGAYTDHIARQVKLYRNEQKEQDRETLRKLNRMQLVENKKDKKQVLVVQNQCPPNQQSPPQLQSSQLSQPPFVVPVVLYPQPVCGQIQNWRGRGRGSLGRGRGGRFDSYSMQSPQACFNCGQDGHFARDCNRPGRNSRGTYRGGPVNPYRSLEPGF